jgi:hypothetical protein
MARDLLSPVGILDATHGAAARAAAPWLGVLWLATIPLRLVQAYFLREVLALGPAAPEYGHYLTGLAWAWFAAFLPAAYGRAVWVRACHLTLQSGRPVGAEALRVPPAQMANAVYAALAVEALFALTAWTFFAVPILAVFSALAFAAALRTERPSLLRPLAEMARLAGRIRVVLGVSFTAGVGALLAFLNVYCGLRVLLWAGSALGGRELPRWEYLLRPLENVPVLPAEALTALLCAAGALLIVEPFWLASFTVLVHRSQLRETGEDLRLWFRTLTGAR